MALMDPKIELMDDRPVHGATRVVTDCYEYTDNDQIGEGTYGKVYKGIDKHDKERVALKMIRMDNEKEGFPITAIREIKLLSTLKHENIVNLREIVRSRVHKESKYKGDIFMVFDYAEHDLTGMMDAVKHKSLRMDQIKCIMLQLLKGLSYIHQNGILHRDLKASNLLINRKGILKIADFGLARNFATDHNGKLTNRVITLWYRPPELLLGSEHYGPAVDVWSVGCIFAELLAKKPLFPGNNEQQQLDMIFKVMGVPSEATWPGVSQLEFFPNVKTSSYKQGPDEFKNWCKRHNVPQEAQELLTELLQMNPARRIKAIDALMHPYFCNTQQPPCAPSDLPHLPDCHEWTTKKRKQQQQQQQHGQQQHQGYPHGHHSHHSGQFASAGYPQQQHPSSIGGAPGHYVGHIPGGMHPGVAAAAAVGYSQSLGMAGRNIRPRTSGGGGPMVPPAAGAAAGGGYRGPQQPLPRSGYNPAVAAAGMQWPGGYPPQGGGPTPYGHMPGAGPAGGMSVGPLGGMPGMPPPGVSYSQQRGGQGLGRGYGGGYPGPGRAQQQRR